MGSLRELVQEANVRILNATDIKYPIRFKKARVQERLAPLSENVMPLLDMPIRAYSAALNCPTIRNDHDQQDRDKKAPEMFTSKLC